MADVFYLPQMGQTMTEGTILRWLKAEGEPVQGWENLVEMMTDKINMEVDSQLNGTLLKILAPEGSVVPVGAPIAVIGSPDENITALLEGLAAGPAPAAAGSAVPAAGEPAGGNGQAAPALSAPQPTAPSEVPAVSPRARQSAAESGIDWRTLQIPGSGFEGMVVERDVLALRAAQPAATPLAAKLAADLGVPLAEVPGTGPRGRVRAEDVRQAAGRARAARAIEGRDIPLTGMRKVIAQRLAASYRDAVHVPLRADVDMHAAGKLRRQLNPALEAAGVRITYTDLLAAAVAQALLDHPLLNATLEGDVVRVHPSVHLGIAVALDDGLTVPVVPSAQNLTLPELSRTIRDLAAGARAGSLPPDAYQGGTFTLSNLGNFGVDQFDPILNPPQVGILGAGRIREAVVPVDGAPAVRPMMHLTLCFDHRALDGAPAGRFLARVKELLENPVRLLL